MAKAKEIKIAPVEETTLRVTIVGDSDLILNKKSRSYELSEIFKQSNPKGTEMPEVLKQPYCLWEKLLTSVTWEKPIQFHDEDHSLYTEEEWKETIRTNRPCILSHAFHQTFLETFKTFQFKETTGRAGTDLKRSLNLLKPVFPVDFASATYEQKLIPSKAIGNPNVIAQCTHFSNWSCTIEIACPNKVFPFETLLSIIQTTGKYIGIGTQRAEGYGRYHIGNVEIIE